MNEILGIIIASIISWISFLLIDVYFGLLELPGIKGAENIGRAVKKRGGNLAGGFFQGNVVCSPDASAGILIGSIAVMLMGYQGGIIAALLIYIGCRLCADPGYAGTIGALTIIVILFICSPIGLTPSMFVVGMIIAILTIQGLHHPYASKLIAKIAKKNG